MQAATGSGVTPDHPPDPRGEAFLAALVAQDPTAIQAALTPEVRLRALLPGGLREWTGAEDVTGRFEHWFGDTEQLDPLEVSARAVGTRLHLRWRFRIGARRLGTGVFVVEQSAYADLDPQGRIERLDLVCTGYLPEGTDA